MRWSVRRASGPAIAGTAFVLAAWTGVWTAAAFFDDQARSLFYEDDSDRGRAADLDRAGRLADRAIALNPLDAGYRRTRAEVASARAKLEASGPVADSQEAARPARLYQEVVARRPAWGAAWAELALARQAAGQPPEEVLASLRRAIYFAPYEPFVRETALRLGMGLLDDLAPYDRQAILWVSTYTLQRDVGMLRAVAPDPQARSRLRSLFAGSGQTASLDAALQSRR